MPKPAFIQKTSMAVTRTQRVSAMTLPFAIAAACSCVNAGDDAAASSAATAPAPASVTKPARSSVPIQFTLLFIRCSPAFEYYSGAWPFVMDADGTNPFFICQDYFNKNFLTFILLSAN